MKCLFTLCAFSLLAISCAAPSLAPPDRRAEIFGARERLVETADSEYAEQVRHFEGLNPPDKPYYHPYYYSGDDSWYYQED